MRMSRLIFVLAMGALCLFSNGVITAQSDVSTTTSIEWVGEMYPASGSATTIASGSSVDVYVKVYDAGVTDSAGQGAGITCDVLWSAVEAFGDEWADPTVTEMTYNVDTAGLSSATDNDEYVGTLTLPDGLYEFTAYCADSAGEPVWVDINGDGGDGDAMLTVGGRTGENYTQQRAIWLNENTIAWNTFGAESYELHSDVVGGDLTIPSTAGSGIPLSFGGSASGTAQYPYIDGYDLWTIPAEMVAAVPEMLRGEFAIAAYDAAGNFVDATGIQIQGVLDDLYAYDGALGVTFEGDVPSIHVWAPTAKSIQLRLDDESVAMTRSDETGVWSVTGTADWYGAFYNFEVDVFVPETGAVETNIVTDPYAISLATDSKQSQIISLDDPDLMPLGWDELEKIPYGNYEDIVIYETHVRDFSRDDLTVPAEHRGKFTAFTYDGMLNPLSDGMAHILNLQAAGLTHIHLLPAFDIGSVPEESAAQMNPDYGLLDEFAADSDQQQAVISESRGLDGWNWGYDPYHFGAPEGSFSTDPDGAQPVLEFREMVQSLNENGLRVVMDVVYNHTHSNGQWDSSVLDRIVPGYYHRYNRDGYLQMSSCCADTAAEFTMMHKLMTDTMLRWATAYKVDGFRFDLMNLHTIDDIKQVRATIDGLTLANDGVDGRDIYIYGEGWEFGSAMGNGLSAATQFGMAGSGIGTFNDRIRDAVHGGHTTDASEIKRQGVVNGLATDWNGAYYEKRSQSDYRFLADRLRVTLAGSLQNYPFIDQAGANNTGIGLNWTGYTLDPQETVNYVSKHDNETLYDLNVYRLPAGTSMAERVRVQNLALDFVGLSQGIPFFQLASDMLRSKSLDRNSYDSGDWFNRIDFTYSDNYFGMGLPPQWDNGNRWDVMRPLLADEGMRPTPSDIQASVTHLQETLMIRTSSPLFRLTTEADVIDRLKFHNTGGYQTDGLIVMTLSDETGTDIDPNYENIIVLFNADKFEHTFAIGDMAGRDVTLHPVQANSADPIIQTASYDPAWGDFTVPARSAAVFVELDTDGETETETEVEPDVPSEPIEPVEEVEPERGDPMEELESADLPTPLFYALATLLVAFIVGVLVYAYIKR